MAEEKKSFFARLREGLTKTRNNIVKGFDSVFSGYSVIDDEFYEELEETMIMGDLGGRATEEILDRLKEQVNDQGICDPQDCREILIDSIREQMHVGKTAYDFEKEQSVVMVIGVNGVGKTTSIGKLASKLKKQGRKVLIAAADTFRAAAGDQLEEWANRAGVDMIGGVEGSDPASVIYDAVNAAKARHVDVLLCDTAGRLHNKKNLMEELRKMNRIIDREFPGCPSGKSGRTGRHDRTERAGTGAGICAGYGFDRYYPDQNGWNRQGRYCGSNSVGTARTGKIYRCRGENRGSAEV